MARVTKHKKSLITSNPTPLKRIIRRRVNRQLAPKGWDLTAHQHWQKGEKVEAIQVALTHFNNEKPVAPHLAFQISYYFFLINDYRSALTILLDQLERTPKHIEILLNLSVCYSRLNQHQAAIQYAQLALEIDPNKFTAWDILAKSLSSTGREEEASKAGTQSLQLKDRATRLHDKNWQLPDGAPENFATQTGKQNVIAFSLWGDQPAYLRGALHNLILSEKIYPGWVCQFNIDDSVPAECVQLLKSLGGQIIRHTGQQRLRQKLGWRFQVANDTNVGYFLIRDVDSVINLREAMAVAAWKNSGRWFHVMRDWWTHTDLVLAGMWGGVAGILPDLKSRLSAYQSRLAETPNIDQWFLRDRIWPYLRTSCLVHDRCFRMDGSVPFPGSVPANRVHIGQDEYAARGKAQEAFLLKWIKDCPALGKLRWHQ